MSKEIELKLAIAPEMADNVGAMLSDFHILQQQQVFLGNAYYDSADRYFARHQMGLRVRQQDQQFVLTLKTNGEVIGGLHARPEYNFPQPDATPDLAPLLALPDLALPTDLQLEPIFSTNFKRQTWLIECGQQTEIEVALDRGEIAANGQIQPICELEFELKCGELSDLFNLVANLTFTDGVRLSNLSKAQRGYQLAQGHLPSLTDWIEKWRDFLKVEQTAVNSSQILTALLEHEQQLVEETLLFGADFFAQDFLKTVERVGAFFNLYYQYMESGKLLQQAFDEQIAQGAALDESLLAELWDCHQYLFAQIREIIRLHSESKDNALAMRKLTDLVQQAQLVKRMINLLKLTVA